MNQLEKLLSIGSDPFLSTTGNCACLQRHLCGAFEEIQSMLDRKNGFTAFESALVVFPTQDTVSVLGIDSWNAPGDWRKLYRECVPEEVVFFAEDLFGGQFGALESTVFRFNPESGELSEYANSLVDWAELLLGNYAEDTGWPLAHNWQLVNGPISPSQRLLPKKPFILGGDYVVENLVLIEARKAMENWGRLYHATRSVPNGNKVVISNWLM